MDRRMVITENAHGWLVETEYLNGLGYWVCLSRTTTTAFPMKAVERVANREDYAIIVRNKVQ